MPLTLLPGPTVRAKTEFPLGVSVLRIHVSVPASYSSETFNLGVNGA